MEQNMNVNNELLNFICQNADMGKETIRHLRKIVTDESFNNVLESQLKEYNEIYDTAQQKLAGDQESPKQAGKLEQLTSSVMINMNTLLDKSPAHIAEMMIQGSTMGIVDITKKKKEFYGADRDCLRLAERLLKSQQDNIEEMKKFLQ